MQKYEIVNRKEFFEALIAGDSVDNWEMVYDDGSKCPAMDTIEMLISNTTWYEEIKLQRKQEMLELAGISFPKPLMKIPVGTRYYWVAFTSNFIYDQWFAEGDDQLIDGYQITPEAAWQQARAFRKFLTGVDIGEYVPPAGHV